MQNPLAGQVRWMLIVWFLVFAVAYAVVFSVVMNFMTLDFDARVNATRYFSIGGIVVGLLGAKLMTRKRYQKGEGKEQRV